MINIEDIAWSLSQQVRFTGHTKLPYSIAEHCCRGCDAIDDEFKLDFLLHDASEAYMGDCNAPLKQFLPQFKEIENRVDKVIARKFRLKYPHDPMIKTMDLIMLSTELRDLLNGADYKDIPYKPLKERINPWTRESAYEEFMERYNKLSKL